jgi:hypothetical protein
VISNYKEIPCNRLTERSEHDTIQTLNDTAREMKMKKLTSKDLEALASDLDSQNRVAAGWMDFLKGGERRKWRKTINRRRLAAKEIRAASDNR